MRCSYHVEREAASVCSRCGKPLCGECSVPGRSGEPMCSRCIALDSAAASRKKAEAAACLASRRNLEMEETAYYVQNSVPGLKVSGIYTCPSGGLYVWLVSDPQDGNYPKVACSLHYAGEETPSPAPMTTTTAAQTTITSAPSTTSVLSTTTTTAVAPLTTTSVPETTITTTTMTTPTSTTTTTTTTTKKKKPR